MKTRVIKPELKTRRRCLDAAVGKRGADPPPAPLGSRYACLPPVAYRVNPT